MEHYIQQTLVFIGAAIVLVPLFQRLGLGSVLGYLIAGIVVGPYGLKLIADSESVLHFAELGVVLLLFMIGLEIQPQKLWSMRRHLLGLGAVQVAASSVVFSFVACLLGLPFVSAAIVGFALSLSSTAFALQTLTERNQFNTEFGRASFSVLLMQDLVAIPALALIPILVPGEVLVDAAPAWQKPVGFVAILILLVLASRFLIRPIFRLIVASRTREIFTAATLFIVLGVAVLMQKVGLSAALGTFIAGVLLADSEYRHELEANLDPFKSLFMGLFFIAIGMSVSLELIARKPLQILGVALGYLALKWLLLYGTARLNKLSHESSKLMSFSIAQGGEFAFVIFGMAAGLKILPVSTVAFLTAVITLSMALSPLLSKWSERWSCKKQIESAAAPVFDVISNETPQVIIAGFGRFGQIFGRILRAQEIPFVAIDHDSEHVELVRKFGSKVYYGDASREDLLESAGARHAKYFVLAVDEVETSLKIVQTLREHFPQLKIFARARNRGHAYDLMDQQVPFIKRELFDSSILFVKELLVEMGIPKERAKQIVERFKRHDELQLIEQFKVRHDDKMFVSVSKQSTAQLAQVLNDDTNQSYLDTAPR